MSPLSRTVAHAVSNYASQAGLTMDALRDDAGAHAGNLRAELMQTTGNTQLFTNQFVADMLGGLTGGAPNVDAIDKVVGGVIAAQEARMQQVNAGMGATLNASQSTGTGQRDMSASPMMTQMAFMTGNNAATGSSANSAQADAVQPQDLTNAGANAGVVNHLDQSGAAIGMQGASWGSKVLKRIRTGAIVLGLSAAAITGFMGVNHMNNTPDFDQNRAPIELIQERDQAPANQNFEVVTPAPAQDDGAFGPGAGQVENDKEAAHQEMLQNGGSNGASNNGANNGTPASNDTAPSPPAAENDKEQAHEATYGTSSVNNGGGGGSSVTQAPANNSGNGAGNEGVVTGTDEGVRSGGPATDLGPQDTSRNN